MPNTTLQFAGLGMLILLSGFFSGIESAFTSLNSAQVHAMRERFPRGAARVERLMTRPDRLLSTILIGNNLVNIAAASLATVISTAYFGEYGPGIATGGLTLIILMFGEVTPKQIAIAHNEFVAIHTSRVIVILEVVFRPLVILVSAVSRSMTRLSGGKKPGGPTAKGILSVVRHAASVGILTSQESWFMKNVLRFHEVTVSMIMTHRTKVFSMDRSKSLQEVLELSIEEGYSRFPVYDSDPERIVGIALVRDVVRAVSRGESDHTLKDVMLPAIFVPENRKVQQMMSEFRREHQHMAIVLDEYGGLAGIVTLEDVIEEILGEIYDENETREQERILPRGDGSYAIAGDTPLYSLNERLSTHFEQNRNVQTVGGFLTELSGHIPAEGDRIRSEDGTFTVERMARKRVLEVRFEPADHTSDE